MAAFDPCPACANPVPAGNLHCFWCGEDFAVPEPDSQRPLIQLYPAYSQAEAHEIYLAESRRLAGAGWFPVAHSWGEDRPGVGTVSFMGYLEQSIRTGTLLVTYRAGDGA